jgi:hypothetical protein
VAYAKWNSSSDEAARTAEEPARRTALFPAWPASAAGFSIATLGSVAVRRCSLTPRAASAPRVTANRPRGVET